MDFSYSIVLDLLLHCTFANKGQRIWMIYVKECFPLLILICYILILLVFRKTIRKRTQSIFQ